jgi:hypothetical protein
MPIDKIIVSGASITDSPWFTWADFLCGESKISLTNLCRKGAGNEYIVSSIAKNSDLLDSNTLVIVMFTTIDKFDWYVEGKQFLELQTEKHCPLAISSSSGFWSTGSWFPHKKEYYRDCYYTNDYFCTKSIQQILLLQTICNNAGAKLEILFDSPIWTHTEQETNIIGEQELRPADFTHNFLSQPLSKIWAKCLSIELQNLHHSSLIGFCWDQGLAWYSQHYRAHPPSSSHYQYYQAIVRPKLSKYLPLNPITDIDKKINKFDKLWNDC